MTTGTVVEAMARTLEAMGNCKAAAGREKTGTDEWVRLSDWEARHMERIREMVENCLPSGSGWDNGTSMDMDESKPDRLVFFGSYHHMDEGGGYDGWTEHSVIVTPSLAHGFTVRVTGRDRNGIKEYIGDLFLDALGAPVPAEEPAAV